MTLERDKLKWDAVRQTWRVVTARAKAGVDVSVPIPPDVAQEMLTLVNGNTKYFFWNRTEGQPQTAAKNWSRELRQVFVEAGLPKVTRTSCGTRPPWNGSTPASPLEDVSRLLDHASRPDNGKTLRPVGEVTSGPVG